jgi:hypothetical protein
VSSGVGGWNSGLSGGPDIACDSSGMIHVVWDDDTPGSWGTDTEIMYSYNNSPTGWSNPLVITGQSWNTGDSLAPAIAVDKEGALHVVWSDNSPGAWGTDQEIMYSKYTKLSGWSAPIIISDGYKGNYWNSGESDIPDIAVDDNDTIHVVWADWTQGMWGTDAEIMYVNYTSSKGWSNATVLSDGYMGAYWNSGVSTLPAIGVGENGTVHVVWVDGTDGPWGTETEIMYSIFTPNHGWSNATVISDNTIDWNKGACSAPAICADKDSGRVHVVWENRVVGSGTDSEIWYIYSNTNNGDWTTPIIISDDGSNWNTGLSRFPAIGVDALGGVHVVWQDQTSGIWGSQGVIMYYKVGSASSNSIPAFTLGLGSIVICLVTLLVWSIKHKKYCFSSVFYFSK